MKTPSGSLDPLPTSTADRPHPHPLVRGGVETCFNLRAHGDWRIQKGLDRCLLGERMWICGTEGQSWLAQLLDHQWGWNRGQWSLLLGISVTSAVASLLRNPRPLLTCHIPPKQLRLPQLPPPAAVIRPRWQVLRALLRAEGKDHILMLREQPVWTQDLGSALVSGSFFELFAHCSGEDLASARIEGALDEDRRKPLGEEPLTGKDSDPSTY